MNKELANSGLGAAAAALFIIFALPELKPDMGADMMVVSQGALTVFFRYVFAWFPKPAGWREAKQ